jgi:hypothetical protein
VSPVHPDQLSDAAAKYLKQPAWQTNRADWILLSAFLFDALARTYDTTMSNPGGLPDWSYTFAGGNLAKMVLWRLGLSVTGFALRWLLVPGIVAIVAYRAGGFDIGQGWLWLLGVWAVYAAVRIATFPARFIRNRRRTKAVHSMIEKLGRLERIYVSINGGVFNPTVMKSDLLALNAEGVPVPAPVFAILDRTIQRDPAVFAR